MKVSYNDQVYDAAVSFALRVMQGEKCTPQEIAVLPAVLGFIQEMSVNPGDPVFPQAQI